MFFHTLADFSGTRHDLLYFWPFQIETSTLDMETWKRQHIPLYILYNFPLSPVGRRMLLTRSFVSCWGANELESLLLMLESATGDEGLAWWWKRTSLDKRKPKRVHPCSSPAAFEFMRTGVLPLIISERSQLRNRSLQLTIQRHAATSFAGPIGWWKKITAALKVYGLALFPTPYTTIVRVGNKKHR